MTNPYRSREWATFRAEVMRLDGNACTECGKTAESGAVLQVHHKRYIRGKLPWQYPHEMCATVCKGCHAATHGHIPPRVGWTFLDGWEDLGGLEANCEYCGHEIRYVFTVHHREWGTMRVGEMCCDNLTATKLASSLMESEQRYLRRRKTFISSPRWQQVSHSHHEIRNDSMTIAARWTIERGAYQLEVNGRRGNLVFADMLEAKMKAFELIDSGALRSYRQRVAARRSGRPQTRR